MSNSGVGGLRRLGRYHLAEPLGGGPTGEVFRAKVYGVAGFERQFAVKRFHTQFVIDPETATKVSTAARSYGGLEHPRIARLHEYGVAQGHTFTATELVIGLDLVRLVASTFGVGEPLVTGAAAALVSQAARAVGYAHGRGICHFGICPTNLICTPEGEVKVTDFGFLPPRLPARPAEDPSLGVRIPYLAPEQIVGELTSPATDVYQLGVVAHELFTGERCFSGSTPLDVAQAILSGPLEEPQLPKPLLKVLRRSVARSPFERFPDAGAFADAFDAAVRATPLPGGSRDVGGVVRTAMQRLAEMNENQVSGALSFPLPAPPRPSVQTPIAQLINESPGPDHGSKTLMGMGSEDSSVKSSDADDDRPTLVREREMGFVKATAATPPPATAATPPPLFGAAAAAASGTPSFDDRKTTPNPTPGSEMALDDDMEMVIESMSDIDIEEIPAEEAMPRQIPQPEAPVIGGTPPPPLPPGARRAPSNPPLPPPVPTPPSMAAVSPPAPPPPAPGQDPPIPAPVESIVMEMPRAETAEVDHEQMLSAEVSINAPEPAKKSRRASPILIGVLMLAFVGGGGFFAYTQFIANKASAKNKRAQNIPIEVTDAGKKNPATAGDADAAVSKAFDAAVVANTTADAGVVDQPVDAAVVVRTQPDAAPASDQDKLSVRTTPKGAKVYIDGTYKGQTPITVEGTPDSFRMALIKAGYKLHTAKIVGKGVVNVALKAVTPPGGPGGIKVRCKRKQRYYVFVDGEDIGQLCPTERIGVKRGKHVVEIYDPVTDARRSFKVRVKQTRNSVRVYVD